MYYIAISLVVWSAAAYGVQQQITSVLLKPAHGQDFIYTSVGGGLDFLFRICLYTALILSLPVIVYNVLRFIEPVITKSSRKFILWGSLASGLLAFAGMVFGYFLGLPSALHFLSHQFTTVQIRPLVTIQAYLGFVIVYMVGAAFLFQLPLILVFINRIKPLKPKHLLRYERWVILTAFVLSCLMNPTPNLLSQLLIAGPFILMYQIGILLILLINRNRGTIDQLHQQDADKQALRQAQASNAQHLPALKIPEPVAEVPLGLTPQPAIAAEVTAPLPSLQRRVPMQVAKRSPPTAVSAPRRATFHDIKRANPRSRIQSIDSFRRPSI